MEATQNPYSLSGVVAVPGRSDIEVDLRTIVWFYLACLTLSKCLLMGFYIWKSNDGIKYHFKTNRCVYRMQYSRTPKLA